MCNAQVEKVVTTSKVTFAVLGDNEDVLHHMTLATAPGATPADSIPEFQAYKATRTATRGSGDAAFDFCFCAMVRQP